MATQSGESARIVTSLKKILRARSVTYAALAARIGLSEASIKRNFSQSTFTLDRLEKICEAVGVSIHEVTRLSGESTGDAAEMLSLAQEKALALDAKLFACYYLIANGRSSAEISKELVIDQTAMRRLFARLADLDLVTLLPGARVRSRAGAAIRWRADGPVRRLYEQQVRSEFLQSGFEAAHEGLHFRSAELSEASCRVLNRKLERLSADFRDLADLDSTLPSDKKRSVGCLLAMRPWVFSMFASLHKAD